MENIQLPIQSYNSSFYFSYGNALLLSEQHLAFSTWSDNRGSILNIIYETITGIAVES